MATKTQHAYKTGDCVTLLSGRVVHITKLRKTPGADVNFAPMRNQPWYEGTDDLNSIHTFPQSSITRVAKKSYPEDVLNRVRRVHAEKAAQLGQEGISLVWSANGGDKVLRKAGQDVAEKLIGEVSSGVSTEVLYCLLEFATDDRSVGLKLLPVGVRLPLRRFLKKVRANQAALG